MTSAWCRCCGVGRLHALQRLPRRRLRGWHAHRRRHLGRHRRRLRARHLLRLTSGRRRHCGRHFHRVHRSMRRGCPGLRKPPFSLDDAGARQQHGRQDSERQNVSAICLHRRPLFGRSAGTDGLAELFNQQDLTRRPRAWRVIWRTSGNNFRRVGALDSTGRSPTCWCRKREPAARAAEAVKCRS